MHIVKIRGLILLAMVLFISTRLVAQSQVNYTRIPDKFIKTVEVRNATDPFAPALITLNNTQSQLNVSFDDLRGSIRRYAYTAIHCNNDWTTSRLWPNEYISGLTEDRINSSKSSFSTRLAYTHYSFQFPGTSMQLTRSWKLFINGLRRRTARIYSLHLSGLCGRDNGIGQWYCKENHQW